MIDKIKKSIKEDNIIVDRGVKKSIVDCIDEKKKILKILLLSIFTILVLIVGFIMSFQLTQYYVVDNLGRVNKLQKVDGNFDYTEASLFSFAEDSVILTFGLNYKTYKDQLLRVKDRYDDEAYEKLIREFKRSNYLRILEKYHRIINIIPTNSVYKIVPIQNRIYDVYRSYMVESIGDDGINREEVIFVVRLGLVDRTPRYYHGLKILSIHQMSMGDFKKLENSLKD